jgi:hypothetical protein
MNEDKAIHELKRIADALEKQNNTNQEWLELNKKWHEEAEVLTEKRYQEHRAHAEREFKSAQEWHDEAERLNELRFQEHREREQTMLMAYLATLRSKEEEKQ